MQDACIGAGNEKHNAVHDNTCMKSCIFIRKGVRMCYARSNRVHGERESDRESWILCMCMLYQRVNKCMDTACKIGCRWRESGQHALANKVVHAILRVCVFYRSSFIA